MKKGKILTGDRPSGRLHVGHLFGALYNRVALQKDYETFVLIADVQTLTDNFANPEKVRNNVFEVAMDNLAVGIDPQTSIILIQSQIPEIAELTVFFSNLVTLSRLKRNPTVKQELKQKKEIFKNGATLGFIGYPVSQAADILTFRADLVPVGEDQLPMIEQTREIARKFNQIYGSTFNIPKALVSDFPRVKGLDGNEKMGKSLQNAIYLADSPEEITQKVILAITDPKKIHKNDSGHPEICMIYYYHRMFNANEVDSIKNGCQAGKLGCVECKRCLAKRASDYLAPIREKRKYYEDHPGLLKEIVFSGTKKAQEVAKKTMKIVRERMKIDYPL